MINYATYLGVFVGFAIGSMLVLYLWWRAKRRKE